MSTAVSVRLKGLTIAVYPNARGFGWALFGSPLNLIDWGTISARQSRRNHVINRLARVLDRYEPSVFVARGFSRAEANNLTRSHNLQKMAVSLAETRGITVHSYDREDVMLCFRLLGATTRYEIAQFIAEQVEALGRLLPRKQAIWNGEHPVMGVFSAAALAYTYFAVHSDLQQ